MPDTSSSTVPSIQVKEAELETVRTWLNVRPDLLLAIAKKYTSNPLLNSLPSSSAKPSPSNAILRLNLTVPYSGLTADKIRIRISTKARNVEVDIPLPVPSQASKAGLGKGDFGRKIEQMGKEALKSFKVPEKPQVTTFLPPLPSLTIVLGPLALLLFLAFAPTSNAYANIGRRLVERWLSRWMIPGAIAFTAACHLVIEPFILMGRLRKHRVPILPSSLYLLTVVMIGYGGIDALDRAAVQERMRLIQSHVASHDQQDKGR